MSGELDSELLFALFETAPDGVVVLHRDSLDVAAVNEAACETFGYERSEMLRLNLMDLTAEQQATRDTLASGQNRIALRSQRRKDGSTFPAEIVASEFEIDGVAYRVWHIRDITERVRAERELAESEAKYAVAFKTSPDSVNINRAADGLFIEVNQGFTDLTGYTQADVEGATSGDIGMWAHPSDRVKLVESLQSSGYVENLESEFRCKDGSLRTALMSARLIEMGGETCILSVTRDITRRRLAEAAVQASEAKFSSAFKTSPDAVNITSIAEGRYIDVNDGFCALTGYLPEDVIGKTSVEMELWDDPADRERLVAELAEDGYVANLEATFRRKDGTTLTGLMSARTMELDGEACVLTVTRDISDRIEGERQLKLSERRLQRMVKDVAHAMGRVVESRDPYTHGHQQRVAQLSALVGVEMGLSGNELDML